MRIATMAAPLGLLGVLAGCATSRANAGAAREAECQFTVLNRTGGPLAIRHLEGRSAIEIGAVNPNEQISGSAPCTDGVAYVWGSPIPLQVGAPPVSPPVFGAVELIPGARARVSLHWP